MFKNNILMYDIQINIDSENQTNNKIGINITFSINKAPGSLESVGIVLE